jgi:hypothetical protein
MTALLEQPPFADDPPHFLPQPSPGWESTAPSAIERFCTDGFDNASTVLELVSRAEQHLETSLAAPQHLSTVTPPFGTTTTTTNILQQDVTRKRLG